MLIGVFGIWLLGWTSGKLFDAHDNVMEMNLGYVMFTLLRLSL
jgi:hypothetical protein